MSRYGENIYRRKDGRWEGRYIKGYKIDGKIQYGYVYHKQYSEVRRQLFLFKVRYQENYTRNSQPIKNQLTFSIWAVFWLDEKKEKVRPNTYASYNNKITRHLIPGIGEYNLNELTSEVLQTFFDELAKKMAVSSLYGIFRVLRTCMEDAVEEGYVRSNPCAKVKHPQQTQDNIKAFTVEEQRRIEELCTEEKYGPILFALHTGLRIGEVVGLKWTDIDQVNRKFFVNRSLQRVVEPDETGRNKTQLKESAVKSQASKRSIPLTNRLVELLARLEPRKNSIFVFAGKKNKPLDPRTLRNHFIELKRLADIPNYPFHALRHTFATRCLEANVTITTISALLGHQSVKLTLDVYTNSYLSEKQFAIQQFEKQTQKRM